MYKLLLISVGLLVGIGLFAQESEDCGTRPKINIQLPEGATPWTNLALNNDPCLFQFAIVTDRTGGLRPGIFKEGIDRLNLLEPEFVMSVGDFIPGYTTDENEINRQWDEFEGIVDALKMPFFYVPGNHDLTNEVLLAHWKKRFGPTYYHFIYKDVLFLCLNTEDQLRGAGRGSISDDQYEYVKQVLVDNPKVKWTMVFLHQPLWSQSDPKRWPDIEQLLADRKHSVFAGHVHRYTKYERNDSKYFTLATTGGGSRLRGPRLGEFDHVSWVSMTKEGPVVANLQLEGIWGEDVVTEDIRSYISKVQDLRKVVFEPYFTADTFSEGAMGVKVTNDADVPMKVKLSTGFSWDLTGYFEEPELEVAPNSVAMTRFFMTARKEKGLAKLGSIPININLSLLQEDEPDLAIPFQYKVKPLSSYTLSTAANKINVDGLLDDWKDWPYQLMGENEGDCSAKFNLTYDEDYLYVGAIVTDDELVRIAETPAYNQDAIGIVVGMDPAAISVMSTGSGWYRDELFLLLNPEKDGLKSAPFSRRAIPEGIETICKLTQNGYTMEAAIPLSLIKEKQGENWQSIRFNLSLIDVDPKEKTAQYYFQPDWRGKENVVGSGLFMKQ